MSQADRSAETPRETAIGSLMSQAWLLSAIYLVSGLGVAAIRRFSQAALWTRISWVQDALAHAVLERLRLWDPLLRGLARGQLHAWQARVILASLTVSLIYLQAFLLGLALAAVRALVLRRTQRP